MSEEEAVQIVEKARPKLAIHPSMKLEWAEKMVVRYRKDRATPGPFELRMAWVVTLANVAGDILVQVDDRNGQILHTRRSA